MVRCFFCDIGIRNWKAGDEAWGEQARWYPSCDYVISVKGKTFVQQVQKKYGRDSSAAAGAPTPESQQGVCGASSSSDSFSLLLLKQKTDRDATTMMLKMGYSRSLVSAVLERRHASHKSGLPDVQSFLDAIFEMEKGDEDDLAGASSFQAKDEVTRAAKATGRRDIHQKDVEHQYNRRLQQQQQNSTEANESILTRITIKENREIENRVNCKVCMNEEVSISSFCHVDICVAALLVHRL